MTSLAKKWSVVIVGLGCVAVAIGLSAADLPRPLAIVTSDRRESALIEGSLTGNSERIRQGYRFVTGSLGGQRVVICNTGVGKINAASAVTLLLVEYQPVSVTMVGVAGAIADNLTPGDVVIGAETTLHDVGVLSDQGWEPRRFKRPTDAADDPVFLPADPELLKAYALDKPAPGQRIVRGVIATGDVFLASRDKKTELRGRCRADAVDMESAAVAQVCWQQKIPFIAIRAVCDRADGNANEDYLGNLDKAARAAGSMVLQSVGNPR